CSVTSLLLTLISSTYRSQLVAELFGYGRQTSYAVLAIAAFVCGCTFVHVRQAPSQQPVNKSSQLPGGSEDRNVSAAALRHLSIVGSEGRLAVAQGERRHTQCSRDARTCAVPLFLLTGLPPLLGTRGAKVTWETKCFSVGNRLKSGPYSLSST